MLPAPYTPILPSLGIYGYDAIEPVILASLVTGDPLLLIGESGTAKTLLLNRLAESLDLEHRHYNASLIAFDDLVGFPFPTKNGASIKYIQTPATVWDAEAVFVDEINRCKPEHQNRFFSLIHERCIQGISLPKLVYRWAAMNPYGDAGDGGYAYEGAQPLDAALADRFAFVVQVPDWCALSEIDQRKVANLKSFQMNGAATVLRKQLGQWKRQYILFTAEHAAAATNYACEASNILGESKHRLSPRRVQFLARNIIAVSSVLGEFSERAARLAVQWSLPQRAWGAAPDNGVISAAHEFAWAGTSLEGPGKWVHRFRSARALSKKIDLLIAPDVPPDIVSVELAHYLNTNKDKARVAAITLALYPAMLEGRMSVGRAGRDEVTRRGAEIIEIVGQITTEDWMGMSLNNDLFSKVLEAVRPLAPKRAARASQLFYYLLVQDCLQEDLQALESEFDECVTRLQRLMSSSEYPKKDGAKSDPSAPATETVDASIEVSPVEVTQ